MQKQQARATDLPGWSAPARVSDIPETKGSFGWVEPEVIAVDDSLFLFADGLAHPSPRGHTGCPVLLAWSKDGLAIWAPRTAYTTFHRNLAEPPRHGMAGPGARRGGDLSWTPIFTVLTEEEAATIAGVSAAYLSSLGTGVSASEVDP